MNEKIKTAPKHVQAAHQLMLQGRSTRQMAVILNVKLNTASNYRNLVNRLVGFDRQWDYDATSSTTKSDN